MEMGDELTISVSFQAKAILDEMETNALSEYLIEQESMELKELSVAFVPNDEMARINEQYHGEEGPTDVLSFDYGDATGEIVLAPEEIVAQAEEFDHGPVEECREVLIHGLLHLAGYDHEIDDGEHLSRQKQYVRDLPLSS